MTSILRATEFPLYMPEYDFPRRFRSYAGKCYTQRVSSGLVAKFARSWEDGVSNEEVGARRLKRIVNEHLLLRDAYEAGISVPKPEGLFLVPRIKRGFLNTVLRRKLLTPAILMQYISGITLDRLRGERLSEVRDLREDERKKACSVGLIPVDLNDTNAIYNPLERRVYLVDLELWKRD